MGDVVNMRDYKTKLERDPGLIRTREDAVDHLATELAKMLDEGDTLMVLPPPVEDYHGMLARKQREAINAAMGVTVLECKNGETLTVHGVEMPAGCPA